MRAAAGEAVPEVVLECDGSVKGKPWMLRGALGVLAPDDADRSWSAKPVGCGRGGGWVGVLAPEEPDRSCSAKAVTANEWGVLRINTTSLCTADVAAKCWCATL